MSKLNDTVRTYPRTLMEAFPSHEPYAIEHYKRKTRPWFWVVIVGVAWVYICYSLL
jgi:hypothetical protein